MLRNLGTPLYQDYTLVGRVFGFMIRSVWVICGGLITAFAIIPLSLIVLVYVFLPLLIVIQIGFGLVIMLAGGLG